MNLNAKPYKLQNPYYIAYGIQMMRPLVYWNPLEFADKKCKFLFHSN